MPEERPVQPGAHPADPSMEDILASIRRILNEDEAATPAASVPPPPATEPLTLTEEMLVKEPEATPPVALPMAAAPPEPPPPAPMAEARPSPAPAPDPLPAAAEPQPLSAEALVAPAVAAAASAAIGNLLRAVSQDRGAAVTRGGPSIEDVVREELRPLLKDWLDQHLPGLVERLVRAEIERLVGRALG